MFTVTGKLQELLLREDKLTLDRTIQVCRAYEQSNRQVKELRETTLKVNKLQRSEKYMHRKQRKRRKFQRLNKLSIRRKTVNYVGTNTNQGNKSVQHGENVVNSVVEGITSKQSARRYIQSVRKKNSTRTNG